MPKAPTTFVKTIVYRHWFNEYHCWLVVKEGTDTNGKVFMISAWLERMRA